MERPQRAENPEAIDEQRVNMNRKRTPITAYVPTSTQSPRSESSGSVQIVEGPKPEVIDLSIEEIEAMFMDDVAQQITHAEAQAKADSDAEKKARRSDKPVKRKKTADTNKSPARKDPPAPDPDKRKKRLA
jgi:hypothetical protein